VKDRWVKDGEVFDADSCSELVVNNPIEHRRDDADNNDFKGFHRVVNCKLVKNPDYTQNPIGPLNFGVRLSTPEDFSGHSQPVDDQFADFQNP